MEKTVKRQVAAKWLPKLFRELTDNERDHVQRALADIPLDPSCGTLGRLLKRAADGDIGMLVLPGSDGGGLAAVTFYELAEFEDGTRDFHSLATVSVGAADRRLAETDMPAMEQLARDLGCASMSLRTIRPGLVLTLTERHGWFASEITCRKLLT